MKPLVAAILAAAIVSAPALAFDYDPDNSGFRALDRELTEQENGERLAQKKRLAAEKLAKQRLFDCVDAQMAAKYSTPGAAHDIWEFTTQAVKDCGTWKPNATENDLFADQLYVEAVAHAADYVPDAQIATENARVEWEKAHSTPRTVKAETIKPAETKPATTGWAVTAIYSFLAVFFLFLWRAFARMPNGEERGMTYLAVMSGSFVMLAYAADNLSAFLPAHPKWVEMVAVLYIPAILSGFTANRVFERVGYFEPRALAPREPEIVVVRQEPDFDIRPDFVTRYRWHEGGRT